MERQAGSGDAPQDDRTLSALLSHLFRDSESLLLQQLALLRAETGEALGGLALGALLMMVGLLVALTGALALVTAVIVLLSAVMPLWLACVAVGAAVCAIGAVLVLYGLRRLRAAQLVPRQTLQSLRETGEWLREELT